MKVINWNPSSRIIDITEKDVTKKIIISVIIGPNAERSNYISFAIKRQRSHRADCVAFRGINLSFPDDEPHNWEDCESITILDAMQLEYNRYNNHLTYYIVENTNDFQTIVEKLSLTSYRYLYQELCKLALDRFER